MYATTVICVVFLLGVSANSVPTKDINEVGEKSAMKCLEYANFDNCPNNNSNTTIRELSDGEFPYMALIGVYKKNSNDKQYLCSASLISERFVLTAAHCVTNERVGPPKFVTFGIKNAKEPASTNAKEFLVQEVFVHPSYNNTKHTFDIALIKLDKDVAFSSKMKPVCLHDKKDFVAERGLLVTGWGLQSFSPSKVLSVLSYNATSLEECTNFYKNHLPGGIDDESMLCATPNVADFKVESGAPLQFSNDKDGCVHSVVGIVIIGARSIQSPEIFTRVSSSLEWIESTVWPDLDSRISFIRL